MTREEKHSSLTFAEDRGDGRKRLRRPLKWLVVAAVALFLPGLVWLIYVSTGEGELKITISERDFDLKIDGEKFDRGWAFFVREMMGLGEGVIDFTLPIEETIRVKAGRHELEVSKKGFTTWRKNFRVWRNATTELEVILQPGESKQPGSVHAAGTVRAAVDWIFRRGGTIQIDDDVLKHFRQLPKDGLARANISLKSTNPKINDDFLKHFRGVKQLKRLSLEDTDITDAGLKHLYGLTNLGALDLQGSKVTAFGVNELREVLPMCEIAWHGGLSPNAFVTRPGKIVGVEAWSLETKRHRGHIYAVEQSPDGKYVAAGGDDGVVRVWDATLKNLVHAFHGHDHRITSLAWSPDSQQLVSSSRSSTVVIWNLDAKRGEKLHARLYGSFWLHVESISWSPNGESIAFSAAPYKGEFFSGYTGCFVWDRVKKRETLNQLYRYRTTNIAWSTDFSKLAFGGVLLGSDYCAIRVIDREKRKVSFKLKIPIKDRGKIPLAVDFSANDRQVLGVDWSGDVRVWDLETSELLRRFSTLKKLKSNKCGAAAFSPDGDLVAIYASDSSAITIWNVADGNKITELTGNKISKLTWHVGGLKHRLSWSNDGSALIFPCVAGKTHAIASWNITTNKSYYLNGILRVVPQVNRSHGKYTTVRIDKDQWVTIDASGHYRGSKEIEKELVYAVETDDRRQITLTPEEFSQKYGWKNDPEKVRLK